MVKGSSVFVAILVIAFAAHSHANVDIQNFFPFGLGNGDQYLASGDDSYSSEQRLSTNFNFFNYSHSSLWVNVNGAISFLAPIPTYTPLCTAVPRNFRMISPFWADVDTQAEVPSPTSGISFRESTAPNVLQQAKREVLYAFPDLGDIDLTWSYVVTWNNVTFYRDTASRNIRNTFQTVITTNGDHSFAIFYYNKVQWTTGQASGGTANGTGGTPAQIGFDAGDGENREMLDVSCTNNVLNIATMSNVGKPGVFVFQIDATEIQTPPPVTRPTQPPSDPRSDAVGTECSSDVSKAWLDVVFVIDTSSAMSSRDLLELSGEIATFMSKFNFGQNGDHTTRAAIVTYATEVEYRYNLTDVTTEAAFKSAILKLRNYANPGDNGGNVQGGLQKAFSLLQTEKSTRKEVIILVAAAYNDAGFQGAAQTSTTIQDNGITIATISFSSADGVLSKQLQNISSPGYSYVSDQDGLYVTLPFALTQINCFCPPGSIQFKKYNLHWRNYTTYADCLFGFSGDTLPSFAQDLCSPGISVSVTSKDKQDFVSDYVVPHDLPNKKKYTNGLHLASDGQWKWWGYDGTEYPLGSYPPWGQNPAAGDSFAYEWQYSGFNVKLMPGGDDPKPYVCQSRACDASYVCDLTQPKAVRKI
jgi:alpha-tectorin